MNNITKANIAVEPNGSLTISNEMTTITIQPDGTVAISSYDPIQLTGASLAKLDTGAGNLNWSEQKRLLDALGQRLQKKH